MSFRRLFIVTGDASGDMHGAKIVQQLQRHLPQVEIEAIGGSHMALLGVRLFYHQHRMGAFGTGIIGAIPSHWLLARRLLDHLASWKPDAVLLIDYGVFNLQLAKALKRAGIRVFYYIPPQVWASRRWRLKTIKQYVDHVFCIFPFEQAFYENAGIPVTFVGHPLIEQMTGLTYRDAFCYQHGLEPGLPIVGLFPGSRKGEVKNLLPAMLKSVPLIREKTGLSLQFVLAPSPAVDEFLYDRIIDRHQDCIEDVTFRVIDHAARDVLAVSRAALVVSGTVTLEAALLSTPAVIAYKMPVPWVTYMVFKILATVKHIGLPNILAGEGFLPELLNYGASPQGFANAVAPFLTDTARRREVLQKYEKVQAGLGEGSPSLRVVEGIARQLNEPFFRDLPGAHPPAYSEHVNLSGV